MFREILRRSATYSVAIVVSRLVGLAMLPVYTRYLSAADYGVLELVDVTVNVIGLLIGSRLGNALFYFYFAEKDEDARNKCVSTLLLGSILVAGGVAVASLIAAPWLSELVIGGRRYAIYLRLALVSFACSIVLENGYGYLRMIGRSRQYVSAALANLAIGVCISVTLLVGFGMGLKSVLIAGLASTAVVATWVTWTALAPMPVRLDFKLFRRQLVYSLPLGVSAVLIFGIHYGDRIFLRWQVPLAAIGVYSLAYKLGMTITFLHAPFNLHWSARVSAVVHGEDGARIYIKSLTYLTMVLTSAVVLLFLFADPIVRVMTTPAFYGAAVLAPWVGVAYLMRSVGAHLQGVFTSDGKPHAEMRANGVGAVVCLIAYATLIPPFKLWGAVAATLIGFFVILVHSYVEAQRVRYFQFENGRLLRILAFAVAAVAAFYLLRRPGVLGELTVGVLVGLCYSGAIVFGCLKREERAEVANAVAAAWRSMRGTPQAAVETIP